MQNYKLIKGIVNNEIFEEFEEQNGISLFDHAANSCNIDNFLSVAYVLCPDIVEVKGYIFISDLFDRNEESALETIERLEKQYNYNKVMIEQWVNSRSFGDFFIGVHTNSMDNNKIVDEFGKVLVYYWSRRAKEFIVYRALNQKDAERLSQGLGLEAKNPTGTWKLDEHLVGGSSKASWANDPFILTTTDINVARGFNQSGSSLGIIKINLNKVPSQSLKGYEMYPRVNGVEGLPYHYSIWQQEVSVFQNIPLEAIKGFIK